MIRQVTDNDWRWLINHIKLGKFESATQLNDELVDDKDFPFSSSETMVKVSQNNVPIYYVFSNEGLTNVITHDGKIMLSGEENDKHFAMYKKFPESAIINMQFIGFMEAIFAQYYSVPMMAITDMKIRDAKNKKEDLASQIAMYNSYNINKSTQAPHDLLYDAIMISGKNNIPNLSKDYNEIKTYLSILNIIQDTLMQTYVTHEIEDEIQQEELRKPKLVPDEKDPKIIHFIPPQK